MIEMINQQDLINSSFKLVVERENELIEKCKEYKSGNKDENISNLIDSFLMRSRENLKRIPQLAEKLALESISKKKISLTELDKLQILLKDKIQMYKLYSDFVIKNENPEVRKLFIFLRDSNAEDIFHIQQAIQKIIYAEKPVSKSIR